MGSLVVFEGYEKARFLPLFPMDRPVRRAPGSLPHLEGGSDDQHGDPLA